MYIFVKRRRFCLCYIHPTQKKAIQFVDVYAVHVVQKHENLKIFVTNNFKHKSIDTMIENIQQIEYCHSFSSRYCELRRKKCARKSFGRGVYRNQLETHISNGLLDPTVDGRRVQWEDMLFGDAYKGVENLFYVPSMGLFF